MPNIKSASKRDAIAKKRNAINRANRSALRSAIKKFDLAVAAGDKAAAAEAYTKAISSIDHYAGKHLIPKNNAARKKSRLTLALNRM